MDPYAVLGLRPGATPDEAMAAWKRLAKRWHPDRPGAEPDAAIRMAEINAAYDLVRTGIAVPQVPPPSPLTPRHRRPGAWLDDTTRKLLGAELVRVLEDGEDVRLITRAATWASPEAHLAVTDRRLLWLLDDAVTHRVRSLHFRSIAGVEDRLAWPRRRTGTVRVRTREGRKLTFAELEPSMAAAIARHVRAGLAT